MVAGTGLAGGGGRRFLLTGVVSRYQFEPSWNREELAGDLQRMVNLFTGDLGYRHVPVMGLDPTAWQIQDALRDFCTAPDRQPDDYLVVYLAGHGEILPVGDTGFEHILLPADASPADLRRRAVKSGDLAEWMLADTPVRRLLLIVDACYSGMGGLDFARNALARTGTPAQLTQGEGAAVVVVTATAPAQQAIAGAFTAAFNRAVRSQATAGHAPGALNIDAVLNVLRADPELPASQQAQWALVAGSGAIPDFLPNPRSDAALVDLDMAEQDRRWQARLANVHQRAAEMSAQFVPRIAGFTGRHHALAAITGWLETPADPRPLIVTGDPGSGKTAVLGVVAALADPKRRPTVPRDGLPVNAVPRQDVIDVAMYVGNLTTGQVLAGLAAAAGIDDIDPDPTVLNTGLARLISGQRHNGRPLIALIDALDEAADPPHLVEQLLRPLIERAAGAVRLLIGTRRQVCDHLGRGWQDRSEIIDLDSRAYADPLALAAVVRRILLVGTAPSTGITADGSPFARCPQAVLDAVVAAIAAAAGHSFVVARILAATQAAQPAIPDPADRAWRTGLPRTAGPAMRRDLDLRLGDQAARAVDLMLPLAYAQGKGLPWEDVWVLLANSLAPGQNYTNEDMLWLVSHAGSYIAEGGAIADRSVYRLYHRSLAEHLRAGRDQVADERAITAALKGHVPRWPNGRRDWSAAHPYTRTFLSSHTAHIGDVDNLAEDPGFLLAADPPQLLAAFGTVTSTQARAAAEAYRRVLPMLDRHAALEHPGYLSLGARCAQAEVLAERIATDGLDSPWLARWASWWLQGAHHQLVGHLRRVKAVATAVLEDAPVVISGSEDCTVRVWDLATGAPIGDPLAGHTRPVNAVATAVLNDPPVVVSGSDDRTVRVWDLATGAPIGGPLAGHTDWVRSVATAMLGDRPVVISGSDDRTVRVWDLSSGDPIGDPLVGHDGRVTAVVLSEANDQPVVISGSDDCTVRVWDLTAITSDEDPRAGHTGSVNAVATAVLGDRPVVISGSEDRTVRVWDLATGAPIGDPLAGHTGPVNAVATAVLNDAPVVVSGSDDCTVRVWDLATCTCIADLAAGSECRVNAVAVSELGNRQVAVSGSREGTLQMWDLITGESLNRIRRSSHQVISLAAAQLDGRPVVVSGRSNSTIQLWDLGTGEPIIEQDNTLGVISASNHEPADVSAGAHLGLRFTGHLDWIRSITTGVLDGRPVVISGSDDRTIRVWDLANGASVGIPFTGHTGWVRSVATGVLDGRPVVISGSDDRTIQVWDLATGTPVVGPFTGHSRPVNAVTTAGLRGDPVVVSCSDDRTIRVWDLGTGRLVSGPFTGHAHPVNAVASTQLRGRPVVISGSEDRTVRVWDLATGTPTGDPMVGHTEPVNAVAAGHLRGQPVALSCSDDATVRVWDLATGEPIGDPMMGHTAPVNAVAAEQLRGRPVVITGGDNTIRVWDLATGVPASEPFTGHADWIRSVATTELDGRMIVLSASDDATVRVWDLDTGAPLGAPLICEEGPPRTVATPKTVGQATSIGLGKTSVRIAVGAGNIVGIWVLSVTGFTAPEWKLVVAPEIGARVLSMAWSNPRVLVVATELGTVVLNLSP